LNIQSIADSDDLRVKLHQLEEQMSALKPDLENQENSLIGLKEKRQRRTGKNFRFKSKLMRNRGKKKCTRKLHRKLNTRFCVR
jgi:SMC interacting uncharacterized protein involved in chromosome segregation